MKIIKVVMVLLVLSLGGCSSLNYGKFNWQLAQRKNAVTGELSNEMSPQVNYTVYFEGEQKRPDLENSKAMHVSDNSSDVAEIAVLVGLAALAVALTKKDPPAPKKPVCSSVAIPFPPYISTTCF